ncbi:hypothetical protein DPMN_135591 [Dreissena polymorpha]|uniref:Uncharacterized protein n=1 Tax=Dreissena polymorpha TaxID=45954 RepID=A0A9D4FZG8_DREPO|nr:hypothetical protein DPMN_135591 [Dreissena polymorpha]
MNPTVGKRGLMHVCNVLSGKPAEYAHANQGKHFTVLYFLVKEVPFWLKSGLVGNKPVIWYDTTHMH